MRPSSSSLAIANARISRSVRSEKSRIPTKCNDRAFASRDKTNAETEPVLHPCQSDHGRVANKSHVQKATNQYQWPRRSRFRRRLGTFAVYICLCNALTDRQVKQAAAAPGFSKPGDIYAACGCRAQCGQCARALIDL